MNRTFSATLPLAGAACGLIAGAALANDVSTSFEFTDQTGEFVLGPDGAAVTFVDGEAKTVGNFDIYHTGLFAWMVDTGMTGTIFLETPAESVNLFLRDENPGTNGVLRVLDDDLNVIASFNATDADWTEVNVTSDKGLISMITLENTGDSGYTVIDDFTYCAGTDTRSAIDNPIKRAIPRGDLRVKLSPIADGMTAPNWGADAPGDPFNRLFVTDQVGILWEIDLDTLNKRVFLDVSDRLVELGIGGKGTFDERGLLGVAFHPDYMNNGKLYTYESHPPTEEPDFSTIPKGEEPDHQSVITEWVVPDPADSESTVDPDSARELLRIDQPQFNHDAGAIAFSPQDGMLYISLGDGGAGDDQGLGHVPGGNGIVETNILGSVLRIDPDGSNSANGQYGIPRDNPFVGEPGVDEAFAYGFRNPFRFSFDMDTGELWLGDAGQNDIEEIDVVEAGMNYGWRIKEGSFLFDPNGGNRGFVYEQAPGVPDRFVDPVAEYDHDEGVVVVGGFVQRAESDDPLEGRYIFGDFAATGANDGRIFFLDDANEIFEFELFGLPQLGRALLGFGQDADGEVYVMANSTGTPFEETGVVMQLVGLSRAPVADVKVTTGAPLGGDVDSIREADGETFDVRSGFGRSLAELHKSEVVVGAATDDKAADFIDVAIRSSVDQPAGAVSVSLRNWNTNEFVEVGDGMVGPEASTLLVEDVDAGDFIRAGDGRIEVLVKHIVAAPFLSFQFDASIDLVEVGVR